MSETDDEMHEAVRSAIEQHGGVTAEPEALPTDRETREAVQAVDQVLNEQDRQRQPSRRDTKTGRFRSSKPEALAETTAPSVPRDLVESAVRDQIDRDVAEEEAARQPTETSKDQPPSSWSAEAKAEFRNLSPAVQQAVLKREDEMAAGQQQYSEERQRLKELDSLMAPGRQYFAQFGLKNDVETVGYLMQIAAGMASNTAETWVGVFQHQPPAVRQQILQRLDGVQNAGPSQQQIEAHVQQRVQYELAKAEVQRFEQNAPEHYSVVRPLMQQLLQAGQATSIQHAYDLACKQSAAIQSIEQQRRDRARLERKVRANGASLSGGPYGTATPARSNGAVGKFVDVAADVRAALSQLS